MKNLKSYILIGTGALILALGVFLPNGDPVLGRIMNPQAVGVAPAVADLNMAGYDVNNAGGVDIDGWELATSTVVCMAPEVCEFQADGTADEVQVQQAVDAVSDAGGIVFILRGDYSFSTSTTITAGNGVTIQGAGRDATIITMANGANDYAFRMSNASGVSATIKDMKIAANGQNQTAGGGIYAKGAVQSVFSNIHIEEPYDYGIFVGEIGTGNVGHHNKIENILIDHGERSSGKGVAIEINGNDENYIHNVDLENNGTSTTRYHIVDKAGGNQYSNVVCVSGGDCLRVENTNRVNVSNMICDGSASCINLNGNSDRNNFSNITAFLIGDDSTANTASGLYIENGSDYNSFSNVTLESHTTDGVTRSLVRDNDTDGTNTYANVKLITNGTFGTSVTELTDADNNIFGGSGWANNYFNVPIFTTGLLVSGTATSSIFSTSQGGSASSPAIILNGDYNSGIYQPGGDQLAIAIAGTGKFFFDNNGRFGVNTGGTQDTDLHVVGNGMLVEDSTTPTKGFRTRFGGATDFEFAGAGAYLSVWDNGDFSGTQRYKMVMKRGEDITQPIGTWEWQENPDGVTHHRISGLVGSDVTFNEDGHADSDFRIETDTDANALFVQGSSNNVGIGTTSPATKLDVYNATATSSAYIYSGGAGLGGRLILEDVDGAGCTEVTALNGTLTAQVVACP